MAARYDVESISDMMEGDDVEEPESGQGPSGFLACTGCVAACTKALRLKTIVSLTIECMQACDFIIPCTHMMSTVIRNGSSNAMT